jgi:hypothetical protein
MNRKIEVLKVIMWIIGMALIIWKAGFITLLGIFLLMWSNNADYVKKD